MEGKTGIVAGGASGIGEAVVLALLAAGAGVLAVDCNGAGLERLRALAASPLLRCAVADIAHPEAAGPLVEECLSWRGQVDFLVNSAAVTHAAVNLAALADEAFRRTLAVNLTGTFLMMQAAAAKMTAGGAIVNVASTAGIRPVARAGAYSASKHGVVGLSSTAALELAQQGVRVNVVCPGVTDTPLFRATGASVDPLRSLIPMGRIARPEEIAAAVVWLLSDQASYVTGAVLSVDGGLALT